ncbi:MAG: nucleoid occlusion factor SlmA [Pseudomonadales bacterium]|nr:nucleoid occlusion factor SlmA [Pseudomonadales bacterium]
MSTRQKGQRRQEILQSLVSMLEQSPGARITTAKLAAEVGVSEAALYRHFPSKSKMFEGLIEFIEEAIFSRITLIQQEDKPAIKQCEMMLSLLLTFVERNPGITRLLTGDALAGETERLRERIAQFYNRLETQLKQTLREAEMREGLRPVLPVADAANLLLSAAEGRIMQFVRSDFQRPPTAGWHAQWEVLSHGFFRKTMSLKS